MRKAESLFIQMINQIAFNMLDMEDGILLSILKCNAFLEYSRNILHAIQKGESIKCCILIKKWNKNNKKFLNIFLDDNYGTDHITASHYLKGMNHSMSNKITVLLSPWTGVRVSMSMRALPVNECLNKFPD